MSAVTSVSPVTEISDTTDTIQPQIRRRFTVTEVKSPAENASAMAPVYPAVSVTVSSSPPQMPGPCVPDNNSGTNASGIPCATNVVNASDLTESATLETMLQPPLVSNPEGSSRFTVTAIQSPLHEKTEAEVQAAFIRRVPVNDEHHATGVDGAVVEYHAPLSPINQQLSFDVNNGKDMEALAVETEPSSSESTIEGDTKGIPKGIRQKKKLQLEALFDNSYDGVASNTSDDLFVSSNLNQYRAFLKRGGGDFSKAPADDNDLCYFSPDVNLDHHATIYCFDCHKKFCRFCFEKTHPKAIKHRMMRTYRRKLHVFEGFKEIIYSTLPLDYCIRLDDVTFGERERLVNIGGGDYWTASVLEVSFTLNGGRAVDKVMDAFRKLAAEDGYDDQIEMQVVDVLLKFPPATGDSDGGLYSKGRLTFNEVYTKVRAGAGKSLDYIVFVIAAAIIASVGLTRDDVVSTVASMLISPIMGPIMGVTFGAAVNDWALVKMSIANELLGLGLCIVTGFIVGLIFSPWADEWNWPSEFMESRGDPIALLVGLAIAIPSGLGVALSITGANTSGLVGVAISASLLPPAVNAGLCWGLAAAVSSVDRWEVFRIGGYSLLLTLVNIFAIIITAYGGFRFKEILPARTLRDGHFIGQVKVSRIENTLKGNDPRGAEIADALFDKLGYQRVTKAAKGASMVSSRMLENLYISNPPIILKFSNIEEEIFDSKSNTQVIADMRKILSAYVVDSTAFDYDITVNALDSNESHVTIAPLEDVSEHSVFQLLSALEAHSNEIE